MNKKIGALVYDAAIDRMDVRYGLNRYLGGLHCGEQFEVLVNGSGSQPESRRIRTGIWSGSRHQA